MIAKHKALRSLLWIGLLAAAACQSEEARFLDAMKSESYTDLLEFIAESEDGNRKEEASFELARRQNNVAAYLKFMHHFPKSSFVPMVEKKIDSLGMVLVSGGAFLMGCDTCNDDEKPMHSVTLRSYYMDKTEVTVAQFREFIKSTNYKTDAEREGSSSILVNGEWERKEGINWRHDVAGKERPAIEDTHPVIHVSWFDARAYAEWCGKRLPTEAEWEFAAKGGTRSQGFVYSGSNVVDEVGWFEANTGPHTNPVALKKPNELGIYDLSGNVYEWCNDWFEKPYYNNSELVNPTGPQTGTIVALRGGGWNYDASGLRCTNRINAYPLHWYGGIGFRCVADVTPSLPMSPSLE